MCSETLDFAHSGVDSDPEWFEVAGPEHKNVTVSAHSDVSRLLPVFVGPDSPISSALGFVIQKGSDPTVIIARFVDARESVWIRLAPTKTATVIRGSAEVKF